MPIFKKSKKESEVAVSSSPQTMRRSTSVSTLLDAEPLSENPRLYTALREAVPFIDAAIFKLTRLIGGFQIECGDKNAENALNGFLTGLNAGGNAVGITSFISSYFDRLLTFGTAVGEIVPSADCRSFSLYCADISGVFLKRNDKNPLEVQILRNDFGKAVPVRNPERILLSVLNPESDNLYGRSLLKGLPFVSSVLLKIYDAIGTNWDRLGNVRFAVTYKPQNDALDRSYAKDRAMQIAKEWGDAMRKTDGTVRDFIAVGDVEIKVIGADNNMPDSSVPVRQMLEQIIAKTGLPPFLLGVNWSTTERMSSQQSDLMTSELQYYRSILTPVILKIAQTYLRMNGFSTGCEIIWDEITLQDTVEEARAALFRAQASKVEN
ncbi:MAG: serine/threonine protein phosphatase [Oscillospiraceae bacterium]|nr:serine/threonine protein phosphatase [Oscillospiraceae bacterium]